MLILIGVINSLQRISAVRASLKLVKCKILETRYGFYQRATYEQADAQGYGLAAERVVLYRHGEISRERTDEGNEMHIREEGVSFLT